MSTSNLQSQFGWLAPSLEVHIGQKNILLFAGVQNAAHRHCGTLQTQRSERGGLGGLGSQDAPVRTGGPWHRCERHPDQAPARARSREEEILNSCAPSAMNDQVTEASKTQSERRGGEGGEAAT